MATNPQDANASQQQVVAILEEDEFEEFEAEDWDERQEDPQQQQLWEQDWDDDNLDDDFSKRLKEELAKRQQK